MIKKWVVFLYSINELLLKEFKETILFITAKINGIKTNLTRRQMCALKTPMEGFEKDTQKDIPSSMAGRMNNIKLPILFKSHSVQALLQLQWCFSQRQAQILKFRRNHP